MGKGKYSAKTSAEGEHSGQGGRDGGGLCRAAAAGKKDCPHRAGKVGASQMLSPSHTRTDGCWETCGLGLGPGHCLLRDVFPRPSWHLAPNYLGHAPLAKPRKRCAALSK